MGPGVAVAEVRSAVRACLSGLAAGDLALVACSGGADSLALAAAAAFVAPRLGLRAGGVTVDHGLQPGSAERAGVATALVAVAAAGFALWPRRPSAEQLQWPGQTGRAAIEGLHRLHSGHIGDLVAYLTAGVAAFGVLALIAGR